MLFSCHKTSALVARNRTDSEISIHPKETFSLMACIYSPKVPKVLAGESTESLSIVMYCIQIDKQPKKISIHNVGNGRL